MYSYPLLALLPVLKIARQVDKLALHINSMHEDAEQQQPTITTAESFRMVPGGLQATALKVLQSSR